MTDLYLVSVLIRIVGKQNLILIECLTPVEALNKPKSEYWIELEKKIELRL